MSIGIDKVKELAEQRGLEITSIDGNSCIMYNKKEEYCVCLDTEKDTFNIYYAVGEPENLVQSKIETGFENRENFARMVFMFKQRRQIARRAWIRKHGLC